ncbi:MAG: hypothetical protein HKN04_01795 [Rhodothermaceae bacterium]|nr:hypothetical protein [Rhodothermaceae bacterium]
MTTRQKARLGLFVVLGLLLFFVLGDVLGLWASDRGVISPTGYVGISHGSHTHYVPNDWNGDVPLSNFPSTPPPPGMTVGPTGEIIPLQP